MEYSKLIHDYLDGQLGHSEEGELFSELARDASLRQEFNQQVNIHALAKSDMGSITTPADATNTIFSTLGFKIPSSDFVGNGGAGSSGIQKFGQNLSDGFRKYFPNILTATIAAVGTALLLLLLMDRFGPSDRYSSGDYPVVSSSEQSQMGYYYGNELMANAAAGIPNYEDLSGRAQKAADTESDFWKRQYFALVDAMKNDLRQMFAQNADRTESGQSEFSGAGLLPSSISSQNFAQLNETPIIYELTSQEVYAPSVYENALSPDNTFSDNKLSVSFRNLQGRSLVNIDGVNSSDDLWITNLAVAISYDVGDNYAIGIELGNERFAQEFQEITPYQVYNHVQNPTLTWYGGFVRKDIPEWGYNGIIYPYAQAFVGGAIANGSSEFYEHLGPLGKAQFGVHWQASNNVSFNLGAEASWLLYQYQNNIYNTGKVGVTYGVNVGF